MSKKKHIEILARGVFVDKGRILLCHTKGAANTYLPGGHVEFGESARTALCREIKEELGCRAVAGAFLGVVENSFKQKGKLHCEVNFVFKMDVRDVRADRVPLSEEDYIEFLWVPLNRLRAANLQPLVLCGVLGKWLKGRGLDGNWVRNL